MPANYNESAVSGTSWTRCWRVTCENPLGGAPRVVLNEEDVTVVGADTITRCRMHPLTVDFDPTGSIPLLNPTTGEAVGSSMSHEVLFAALYSLYMQAAAARDAVAGG